MRNSFLFILFFLISFFSFSQELFPHAEPASNIPKKVLGVRYTYETFQSSRKASSVWQGLRFMYGLTPKLTVMGILSISNHHLRKFPPVANNSINFFHHHSSTTTYVKNPVLFEGFYLYAKYRFLSIDEEKEHLRFAFYGEFSNARLAHDEAEPILIGDNSGFGGGLIVTKLYKKIAASGTVGFINPFYYKEADQGIKFRSGNAWVYNFSLGYLLLPRKYNSYRDLNVNIYLEFFNKSYDAATFYVNDKLIDISNKPTLQEGRYSEVRPSIQLIFNSNTRVDLSVSTSLYNKSYVRIYPVYLLNFQRYFYFNKKQFKL